MRWLTLLLAAGFVGFVFAADKSSSEDPAKDEMKKLAGTWVAVAQEKDGAELPTKDVDAPTLTLKPDGKYQYQQGDQKQQGSYKVDPSQKPAQMDFTPDDPKDKPMQAIYQQKDNGQMQVTVGAPGKDRPKQFATQKGTGQQSFTYKKK